MVLKHLPVCETLPSYLAPCGCCGGCGLAAATASETLGRGRGVVVLGVCAVGAERNLTFREPVRKTRVELKVRAELIKFSLATARASFCGSGIIEFSSSVT